MKTDTKTPLGCRPIRPDDDPFLFAVYASTRAEEMAAWPWDDAQKSLFLRMQFDARDRSYRQQHPSASSDLIVEGDVPIGCLSVERRHEALHLIDIALLPAHRGRGIGGALLRALLDEAAQARQAVRLHVEKHNRALRLYRRLGFQVVADDGVYLRMEWIPRGEGP